MNLNKIIKEKYGSIDKMIEATDTHISRSYLYQIINGEKINITVEIAKELQILLDLKSLDELMELIDDAQEV